MFALPVCRRPGAKTVTALGGGYLASGVGAKDRMPTPYLPVGLKLNALEERAKFRHRYPVMQPDG